MKKNNLLILILLIGCFVPLFNSATATLYSIADAEIYAWSPTSNFGSGTTMNVFPYSTSLSKRAILKFNLSSYSSISAATLKLYASSWRGFSQAIYAKRVTADWSEGSVTWNNIATSTTTSGQVSKTCNALGWHSWNVSTIVKAWDAGTANYGFMMIAKPEDTSQNFFTFNTRENSSDPELAITYAAASDTTPPTFSSFSITDTSGYTSNATPTLTLSASDAVGVTEMAFSCNNSTWSSWITYATSYSSFNITTGAGCSTAQGSKTVYAKVRDAAANVSTVRNDSTVYDTVKPTASSISISDGASYTNDATPDLTLSASDATSGVKEMSFSCNNSTWSSWITYATSYSSFNITTGAGCTTSQGTKSIYFRVRDNANRISTTISDSIIYDTVNPTASSISISGGATYTNDATPDLTLSASDATSGVKEMAFSCDNANWGSWVSYTTSYSSFNMTTGTTGCTTTQGTKAIYFKVKDTAGNDSSSVSDIIGYDSDVPTISSFAIEGGAETTYSSTPTLSLSASDSLSGVYQMRFSCDDSTWSDWVSFDIAYSSFDLTSGAGCSPGYGEKTIYVQVSDNANNLSVSSSDSIMYPAPNVAPDLNVVSPLNEFVSGDVNVVFDVNDDAVGDLYLDLYLSSSALEFEVPLELDLNLSTTYCYDNNLTDITRCEYSLNTLGITDGNYFLDFNISDSSDANFAVSSLEFGIDNNGPFSWFSGYTDSWVSSANISLFCDDGIGIGCDDILYGVGGVGVATSGSWVSDVNLIGLWHFDGDVVDSSGSGFDGVASDVLFGVGLWDSNAGVFDGVDSVVDLGSDWLPSGDLTFSAWVKPYSFSDSGFNSILNNGSAEIGLYSGIQGLFYKSKGTSWSESYDSTEFSIHSLAVFDNKLYAGTDSSGKVFVFDGSNWSESYDSTESNIYSLAVFDNKLYAGTYNGGKVLVFDGSTWSESYDSSETRIFSLAVFDNKLYAGTGTGGKVLVFDGSTWSESYDSSETFIFSLAVFDNKLYAGTYNGGKVLVFDGSSWSESYDSSETYIYSLAVFDNKLYAGTAQNGKVFVFDGSSWSESYASSENRIYSLAVFDNKLYAGTGTGGKVLVFDGSTWSESYDSTGFSIYSLGVFDNKLYAGTDSSGKVFVFDGNELVSSDVDSINLNEWNHIAMSRNANGLTNFYVNGELSGLPDQNSGIPVAGLNNVFLGNDINGLRGFDGLVEELVVWDRVVSSGEIGSLYSSYVGSDYLSYSSPVSFGADGNFLFEFYSTDLLGNVGDVNSVFVAVDSSDPVISSFVIDANAETTYSSVPVLFLSASDATSGLNEMRFSCDNLSWSGWVDFNESYSGFDFTSGAGCSSGFGGKTVYVQVSDVAGNVASSFDSIVYLSENVAPDLNVVSPLNEFVSGDVNVVFDVDDDAVGDLFLDLYLSSSALGFDVPLELDLNLLTAYCYDADLSDVTRCEYSLNSLAISDGNYFLDFNVVDSEGLSFSTSSLEFGVDNSGPFSWFSGYTDSWVSSANISLFCDDGVGVGCDSILYGVGGVGVATSGSWVFDVNLIGLWHFDGDVVDSSGSGFDGVVSDVLFGVGLWDSNAGVFDGVDSVVDLGSDWLPSGDLTFSAWVKPYSFSDSGFNSILSNGSVEIGLYSGIQGLFYKSKGTSWSESYDSSETFIFSLAVFDNKLYAGTYKSGKVFVFDGSTWSESYDSSETFIFSLAVFDNKLYAGTGTGGKVLVFDGSSWSESYDSSETYIYSLAVFDNKLYAGTAQNGKVFVFDGSSWSESYASSENRIYSLAVFDNKLYAGTGTGGKVFVFDGSTWSESYDSTEFSINSLVVFDNKLYAGTDSSGKVFVFDGSTWSESYDSTETRIYSLAVFDNKLYAGTGTGGKVFVFDGSSWSESYDSSETYIYSLAEYDGKLYAGTENNGKVFVFDGNELVNSNVNSINLNEWNHIAMSRSANGLTNFYVNGELSGLPDQNSGIPVAGLNNVFLGNDINGLRGFDGLVEELVVWDRELSASDVNELYSSYVGSDYLSYSSPVSFGADGNFLFEFYSTDLLGNVGDVNSVYVAVDSSDPVISSFVIDANAETTYSSVPVLFLSASDATSGLSEMRFSCDDSSWSDWVDFNESYSGFDITTGAGCSVGYGEKTVYIEISDFANNTATSSDSIIYTISNLTPDLNIISPISDFYSDDINVVFDVSDDSDSLLLDIFISSFEGEFGSLVVSDLNLFSVGVCDDTDFSNGSRCYYSFDSSLFSDGNYFLDFNLVDSGDLNKIKSSQEFAIDNTAPNSLTLIINSNDVSTDNTTFSLTLSATDNTAISKMQFSCNNTNWSELENYSTSKSFNLETNTSLGCSTENGTKTIYYRVTDIAENLSETTNDTIILNKNQPTINITEPDGTNDYAAETYTIEFTPNDTDNEDDLQVICYADVDASGYDETEYCGTITDVNKGITNYFECDTSLWSAGVYYIWCEVNDQLNATNSTAKDYSPGQLEQSLISITLLNSEIDLGGLENLQSTNTESDENGIIIRNIGNVDTNINIEAIDLWITETGTSSYYQYKVSDLELGATGIGTNYSYQNVPISVSNLAISTLNYNESSNEARVDFNITVPGDEIAGNRMSLVTFTAMKS